MGRLIQREWWRGTLGRARLQESLNTKNSEKQSRHLTTQRIQGCLNVVGCDSGHKEAKPGNDHWALTGLPPARS